MVGNEDTELGYRLLAGGERLWYEPSAIVYHGVPENWLKGLFPGVLVQLRLRCGTRTRQSIRCLEDLEMVLLRPIDRLQCVARAASNLAFRSGSKRRFFFKCTVWRTFGEIVEVPRIWLETKRRHKKRTSQGNELRSSDVTLGE